MRNEVTKLLASGVICSTTRPDGDAPEVKRDAEGEDEQEKQGQDPGDHEAAGIAEDLNGLLSDEPDDAAQPAGGARLVLRSWVISLAIGGLDQCDEGVFEGGLALVVDGRDAFSARRAIRWR